jgi:hypothetical protein
MQNNQKQSIMRLIHRILDTFAVFQGIFAAIVIIVGLWRWEWGPDYWRLVLIDLVVFIVIMIYVAATTPSSSSESTTDQPREKQKTTTSFDHED